MKERIDTLCALHDSVGNGQIHEMSHDQNLICSICEKPITNNIYYLKDYRSICTGCYKGNRNISIDSFGKNYSADCRTRNLDPYSTSGIGYITETLVSKFLKIPTCFQITDNFHYPGYDLLEHEDWGLINVKGSKLYIRTIRADEQPFWSFGIKRNTIPDFFFCIGYDVYSFNQIRNRLSYIQPQPQLSCHLINVESVHIIPNEEYVSRLMNIYIPEFGYSKFGIFKEDPDPWNDLFHTLKFDNCPVLRADQVLD